MSYDTRIGEKWGRYTIIDQYKDPIKNIILYSCLCDCGNYRNGIYYANLTSGRSRSCGCLCKEIHEKDKRQYNTYDLSGEFGIGYTLKGEEFWFDLEDYNKIKDYCWRIDPNGYVVTSIKNYHLYFHKLITNCLDDDEVDHVYHQKYDNRKEQLRVIKHQKNMMNHKISKRNTSGVAGVCYLTLKDRWCAYLKYKGKLYRKSSFLTMEEVVTYRKQLEEKYFGEYAYKEEEVV